MINRYFLYVLFAVDLLSMNLSAEFKISGYGGVSVNKNSISKIVSDNKYKIYSKLIHAFADYQNELNKPWVIDLDKDSDFTDDISSLTSGQYTGFGHIGAGTDTVRHYTSCKTKIERQLKIWRDKAEEIFREEGFQISKNINVSFDSNIEIKILSVAIISRDDLKERIINPNESNMPYRIDVEYFVNSKTLQDYLTKIVTPNSNKMVEYFDRVVYGISQPLPTTTKKNGLTLGFSGAYSKSLFPKVSSTYGLYTGVEGYAEINPNEAKSNGFSIKEKSFGIRPFVGIIKKDNWAIYVLAGVKSAKRDIKSDMFHINKGKLSYEIGVGSDYILSERFSVSAKFIKGLKSKFNVNGLSFQTSSTKILFSLNYHF